MKKLLNKLPNPINMDKQDCVAASEKTRYDGIYPPRALV